MTTLECADCHGQVNVPSHSGKKLRCGCGHTYVDLPDQPPPDLRVELRALLSVLRENKVQSYSANNMTLVLHPDAWKQEEPAAVREPPEPAEPERPQTCKCGHLLAAEHTEAGCVHGCALELCEQAMEAA